MANYDIFGILLNHRSNNAPDLQKIFTKYGCFIKVRLGLHEADGSTCADEGFMILQVCGNEHEIANFYKELKSFKDVKVERMTIES
jgi:metal-responsive CopG/Arc/MetJ family transcriptional regulator